MSTFITVCIIKLLVTKLKRIAEKIIDKTHKIMNSEYFCDTFKLTVESFTRARNMGFKGIIGMCLNFIKKALQLEIDNYMELTDSKIEKPITKQAFSKARQNISPDAFDYLFQMTVETVFEENEIKRYKGYRIFAVDGTELQIPKTKETVKFFTQDRGSTSPRAIVSMLCDVLSDANIKDTTVDERSLAMEHLEYFKTYHRKKDIVIFDRGYPSKKLIKYLDENKISYLMRMQKSFSKEIDNTDKEDFSIDINTCKVRVIKVVLDSGETEVLITNLSKTALAHTEFKDLYRLRWNIETKYNTLKNMLEVETFSGKTVVSILQDFYATMYLSYLVSAIKSETDEILLRQYII